MQNDDSKAQHHHSCVRRVPDDRVRTGGDKSMVLAHAEQKREIATEGSVAEPADESTASHEARAHKKRRSNRHICESAQSFGCRSQN